MPLYVYPECGDVDRGHVSVLVRTNDAGVTWHDMGYENGTWDEIISIEALRRDFVFDRSQDIAAIRGFGIV